MARSKAPEGMNLDEGLARLASPEEKQAIRQRINEIFVSMGNPIAVNSKLLKAWEHHLPHLVEKGFLIRYPCRKDKVEYSIHNDFRQWIDPQHVLGILSVRLKAEGAQQLSRIIGDLTRIYGLNPGVMEALMSEQAAILSEPSLTHYIKTLEGCRPGRALRTSGGIDFPHLVKEFRHQTDAGAILESLRSIRIRHKGHIVGLKVTRADAHALAQTKTMRDVEFILDHLSPLDGEMRGEKVFEA